MMAEQVKLRWSKRENDWLVSFPEMPNRNGKITANIFLNMINDFQNQYEMDFRQHLISGGFDPDTFTISVKKLNLTQLDNQK